MKRQIAMVAVAVFLAFVVAGSVAKADITYTIVDQGTYYQGGWSVNGTITTDGTIGQLSPGDLLSATLTLSNPTVGVYTATDITMFSNDEGVNYPTATQTALQLPYRGGGESSALAIIGANGVSVAWFNPFTYLAPPGGDPEYGYFGCISRPPSDAWGAPDADAWGAEYGATGDQPGQDAYTIPPDLQTLGANMTWVIATTTPVPEPSTIVLLGFGTISMLAYVWRKRTRTA